MGGDGELAEGRHGRIFFGWKVVAAAFLIAVVSWGIHFYGPSIYLHELNRTRGWPVSIIGAAMTLHFLWSALLVAFLTDAYRRLGVARVTIAGIALTAAGIAGWGHASEPWHLFVAATLTGLGWTTMGGAAINSWVSPWFDRRRPAALSHAYNGASFGGVVFTPLWVWLVAGYGFSGATLVVAGITLVCLIPLVFLYIAPTPARLGLGPDGQSAAVARGTNTAAHMSAPGLSRRALLGQAKFWTLALAFALALMAQMGLVVHLVARLAPDISTTTAAWALTLTTLCAMLGRIATAFLIRHLARRRAAVITFLVQAAGVVLLVAGSTAPVLVAGCVLFGLGIGNLLSLPPLIAQVEYAPADVAAVVGLVTAVNQAVYALGPGLFGILRDLSGGYALPFALAAVLQVVAAILVASGPRTSTAPHTPQG